MSRRLSRISLAFVVLATSEVWALGLGEIRLDSALNEPLRAEIELLSATPDELANLQVGLASAETFERYGLDRPAYLQNVQFQVIPSGRGAGSVIAVRSVVPMTEPFLIILVEASWPRGRLLREYTVLLDPPTFAPPPATQSAPAVTAPTRTAPADSGVIERPAPAPTPAPAPRPSPAQPPVSGAAPDRQVEPAPEFQPRPAGEPAPVTAGAAGDYFVARGDTLWGITQRVRPDTGLTINQTMLAIFEANPEAFGGNINILRAGATLRIPGADQVYRISRGDAFTEVQRQNEAWSGGRVVTTAPGPAETRPNLTLVPPDEEYEPVAADADAGISLPLTREQEIEARIAELEAAEIPQQQALFEIRNDELAALREELARIRGEVVEAPVEEPPAETAVDTTEPATDDIIAEEPGQAVTEPEPAAEAEEAEPGPAPRQVRRSSQPTLVDQALGILTNFWTIVVSALLIVAGVLLWFVRRGRGEDDDSDAWQPLGRGDDEELDSTQGIGIPSRDDDSFVVVEQRVRGPGAAGAAPPAPLARASFDLPDDDGDEHEAGSATGQFGSLEDTFSSETAVNLDQSDPIAEADFHMAYGLYDQAADLINGALANEPGNADLLTKLCEIYFVWGNRDLFVDAAGRLKKAVGSADAEGWNKIVIMGQQIAGDHELFTSAAVAGATKAVDLSFEAGMEDTGALDMELIADSDSDAGLDVFDVGAPDDGDGDDRSDDGIDFDFGDEPGTTGGGATDFDLTAEMPAASDRTAEMPSAGRTVETPTIEEQFSSLSATSELPSLDESIARRAKAGSGDETAEINLDDLDLDIEGLDELAATGRSGSLAEDMDDVFGDTGAETGRNLALDGDTTGIRRALGTDRRDPGDEDTGVATGIDFDERLLDATGVTQVISEDMKVQTGINRRLSDEDATLLAGLDDDDETGSRTAGFDDDEGTVALGANDATLLAGLDDEDDYDFAKTEALPADIFTGGGSLDETGELPAVASTDVDLDLDDLTAALEVSEIGDTVEQIRDDATVQQPRPSLRKRVDDDGPTLSLGPDDMSEDLHEARTMTEVGTKLDLARAYVDMGDPAGARSILEEVLDEGDEAQRQQAQKLLDSLPS